MSKFFIGQKVVCVDDVKVQGVKAGNLYTITEIVKGEGVYHGNWIQSVGLRFAEAKNPSLQGPEYHSGRFEPLTSKAISIFRKIAQDVTEGRKVEIVA